MYAYTCVCHHLFYCLSPTIITAVIAIITIVVVIVASFTVLVIVVTILVIFAMP